MKKITTLLLQLLLPFGVFSQNQTLTSVSPSKGNAGQTLMVTITGTNTNFYQASSSIAVAFDFLQGSTTTSANSINVIDDNNLTAEISIPQNTEKGSYDIIVNNDNDGEIRLNNAFNVNNPSLANITPNKANAGQTLTVTITGNNTNFTQASNTVAFDFGQGSSTTAANSVNVIDDNKLTASITVPQNTITGDYDLVVENSIDGKLKSGSIFHVDLIKKPALVSLSPNTANAGQILTVTITGANTHFKQASKTVKVNFDFNQGSSTIVVNSVEVTSDTSINAKITIPQYAVTGKYNLTVIDSIDSLLVLKEALNLNGIPVAIWREDFTNGIPSNWTQSGANKIWKYSTIGSQGKYSKGNIIKSTSATNGFMIFDADYDTVATANYTVPLTGSIITSAIDLTGHADVKLNFQQYFRLCCSNSASLKVSVSTNDSTWTDFDARGSVDINTYSLNPDKKTINISSIAGNKKNVKIKFTFENSTTYHWQIDDISITTSPKNDMVLNKAYTDFGFKNGGYYNKLPLSQASPISYRGAVLNDGSMAQNNVKLKVNVGFKATAASTSKEVYADSSSAKAVDRLKKDTLAIESSFTPLETGKYSSAFALVQSETDEINSNNSVTKTFEITDSVYARDNNISNTTKMYLRQYTSNSEGNCIGTLYDIFKEAYPTSVSAFINTSTALGVSFRYVIYEMTSTELTEILTSDIYDVAAAKDKNKWITLPILNPEATQLNSKSTYMVAVEAFGTSLDNAVVISSDMTTEQPGAVSLLRIKENNTSSWGFIEGVPLIRLNLNDKIKTGIDNVASNSMNLYQNVPNPASKETVIGYELSSYSKVSLRVFDITGKEITIINEGEKAPGKHMIRLNTSNFRSGIYYYTLNDGHTSITKKMIITE